MKTKFKTLTEENSIKKLLKNNNFRNNQNYVLGSKLIYKYIKMSNIYIDGKSISNFSIYKKEQYILIKNLNYTKNKNIYSFFLMSLFLFSIFLGNTINNLFYFFSLLIIMLVFLRYLYNIYFSFTKKFFRKKYNFFSDNKKLLISKK